MFVELASGQTLFICNSLLVSTLLDVSQELPHEPLLGTLVLVAWILLKVRFFNDRGI